MGLQSILPRVEQARVHDELALDLVAVTLPDGVKKADAHSLSIKSLAKSVVVFILGCMIKPSQGWAYSTTVFPFL